MPFDFTEVFRRERDVINFRRRAIQDGRVARARAGLAPDAPKQAKAAPPPPGKGFAVPRMRPALLRTAPEPPGARRSARPPTAT